MPVKPSAEEAGVLTGPFPDIRASIVRSLGLAGVLALGGIVLAAALPAITAMAVGLRSSPAASEAYGPPVQARAAAGVAGNWERSYGAAVPPAGQIGAAVLAGAAEEQQRALEKALVDIAAKRAQGYHVGVPTSLNRASGYAAGTVLRARITIYGCTGPGGGFCGNMASGVQVFEGAAACSADLPFGTKLRIKGDPTGRVYECLDRGALATTWVDVFFNDTSEGIRWQGLLGGTVTEIEIVN